MRRVSLAITVVALSMGVAGLLLLRTKVLRQPPAYPCVATSKDGWLTAVGGNMLLRVEWAPGGGRVGVGLENGGRVTWRDASEADARNVALRVLEPLTVDVGSKAEGTVTFFVGCEGRGEYWRDTSGAPASWRECLRPVDESRLACVRRVFTHRPTTEEIAGAVSDRIAEQAQRAGVAVPPRPAGLGPSTHPSLGGFDDSFGDQDLGDLGE